MEILFIKALIILENSHQNYYYSISFLSFSHLINNKPQFKKKSSSEIKFKPKPTSKEMQHMMKEAYNYIKAGKENFDELHLKEQHPILFGKMTILECKIRCSLDKYVEDQNRSLERDLGQTCEIMKEKGLFYLEILALQSMAEYMIK